MEDDEDDLYGTTNTTTTNGHPVNNGAPEQQEGEEGEAMEDDEEDSDDSDIDIVVERKPGSTKPDTNNQPSRTESASLKPPDQQRQISHSRDHSGSSTSPRPTSTQPAQQQSRISKPTSTTAGSSYPAVHTSPDSLNNSMDSTASAPMYTLPTGESKPLTDLDFDADLAEHSKPWRLPGTDQSDYFNYGFDEFTWATYCLRQKDMRTGIETQKEENKKFEMMFGAGAGGMPGQGMPPNPAMAQQGQGAMGAMGGMPDMNDPMAQQMMQQMMASGMDPSQMNFGAFMQQMQGSMNGQGGMQGQGMPGQMPGNPNAPQGAPAGPSGGQQQGGYDGGQQGYGRGAGGGQRQNRRRQQSGWQ